MNVRSFHLIRGHRAAAPVLEPGRSRGVFGLVLLTPLLVALAGCASVTFKRGASPDSMRAAERACRSSTSGKAAYVACMRERGFFASGAEPATRGGAAAVTHVAPSVPVAAPRTPGNVPAPAPAVAPAAVAVDPPVAGQNEVPAEVPAELDPLDLIDVASWWRLGGSAADLDKATDRCVEELGEKHRPEPGSRAVTAAMYDCLRDVGWRPFGGKGAR